jgi:hypothetical protein
MQINKTAALAIRRFMQPHFTRIFAGQSGNPGLEKTGGSITIALQLPDMTCMRIAKSWFSIALEGQRCSQRLSTGFESI